jgi:integrase
MSREGSKLRSAEVRQATLDRLVLPSLGARPISEIRRSEIIRLLDKIEDERGPEMAHKVLGLISKIMNWHASRSDTFKSPIVKGMGRSQGKPRERTLTDAELAQVWKACEGPFGRMVRFLLLTGARRSEASELRWEEIEGRLWTLPAERNKVGVALTRPLSDAALELLGPRTDGFAFTTTGKHGISGFNNFKKDLDRRSGVNGYTLHDLRRSHRSLMSRAGVSQEIAERALGHLPPTIIQTYDRHKYEDQLKLAYEKLATLIESIVQP